MEGKVGDRKGKERREGEELFHTSASKRESFTVKLALGEVMRYVTVGTCKYRCSFMCI